MNHPRLVSALVATTLGFAFAADAVAGITFNQVAGDTFVAGPTSSTLTIPTINWVIGTTAPTNVVRGLKNGEAIARTYTSTENPVNTLWINPTPQSGTLVASGTTNVSVSFVAALMPTTPGIYNVKYTYTAAAATEPKIAILEFNINAILPLPKLSVAGPLNVETQYTVGDPLPSGQSWTVVNSGVSGTSLNWAVTEDPEVSWFSLTPTSGTQPTGGGINSVGSFDLAGLTAGTYSTTLKFRNTDAPNDATQSFDFPVTLIVANPKFIPGQRLIGSIPTPEKLRTIDVDVLAGLKMTFRIKTTVGNLKPRIQILDSQGAELKTFVFKASKKFKKKAFTFANTGTHAIRIFGDGVTTGEFEITTQRKLPKLALPRSLKNVTASEDYLIVEVPVLSLKGALLNVNVVGTTFTRTR
ncbi:MAG: hypothetical protein IPH13_21840 [Planctomycetes bacterium]|nr:hypothetical protein [Planctomycetota bacterium]